MVVVRANTYIALCARYPFKCFTYINSFNPHNKPYEVSSSISFPILWMKTQGTEWLRNLPKVTQLINRESRISTQVAWLSECMLLTTSLRHFL